MAAPILQIDRLSVQHLALLHPQYRGSRKKPRSDHYVNYQHRRNTLTTVPLHHITNYVQTDGAKRGAHIPVSDVSRPTAQSGILGSICFPPQWLHISYSCHHLPTSHRYQPELQFNPLSSSSHWTFPRRSTPYDTPRCCLSKLAEVDLPTPVYNRLVDFSAATRTIPCSMKTSCARKASRPAS